TVRVAPTDGGAARRATRLYPRVAAPKCPRGTPRCAPGQPPAPAADPERRCGRAGACVRRGWSHGRGEGGRGRRRDPEAGARRRGGRGGGNGAARYAPRPPQRALVGRRGQEGKEKPRGQPMTLKNGAARPPSDARGRTT